MHAHLLNGFQYRIATDLVQVIGSLIHQFRFESGTQGIYFQDRSSRGIVLAVNGAGFATVQMASLASKRTTEYYPNSTAPSRSRL